MSVLKTLVLLAALPAAVLASEKPGNSYAQVDVLKVLGSGGITPRQGFCPEECGVGCMPSGATCCDRTLGSFCEDGWRCTSSTTCCPDGEICTGNSGSCQSEDYVLCGAICIPPNTPCEEDDLPNLPSALPSIGGGDDVEETDSPLFPSPTARPLPSDDSDDDLFPSPSIPSPSVPSPSIDDSPLPSPTGFGGGIASGFPSIAEPSPSIGGGNGDSNDGNDSNDNETGGGSSAAALYGVPTLFALLMAGGAALLA